MKSVEERHWTWVKIGILSREAFASQSLESMLLKHCYLVLKLRFGLSFHEALPNAKHRR